MQILERSMSKFLYNLGWGKLRLINSTILKIKATSIAKD